MVEWGFKGISLGHDLAKRFGLLGRKDRLPRRPARKPGLKTQVVELVRHPIRVELPKRSYRAVLGLEDKRYVPILRDPGERIPGRRRRGGVLLPRLRLRAPVQRRRPGHPGHALRTGAETVLPPGYLCCGYPQTSAGQHDKGQRITTENRVLFHRVANTLNYLDIKTVIVSCGTCMDQLLKYEFEKIFPGCRLLDIHEYLMEKGVRLEGVEGVQYLYHDPCHTPMKTYQPTQVASELLGQPVLLSDRCCGEAGTLGTARPDIANQLRFRKSEELHDGIRDLIDKERVEHGEVKLLTSCPACQQGLAKYADETGLQTDYIVVELARHLLGERWQQEFVDRARNGGIERVLL